MNADKKLEGLLERAFEGELPQIDQAVQKAGYSKGPGWIVYSAGDVARFFKLTDRRIRQLIKEGLPRTQVRRLKHSYDLAEVAEWMNARVKEQYEDPLLQGDDGSPELEKLRRVTRQLKELDLAERQAELIPREDLLEGLNLLGNVLRSAADVLRRQCGNKAHKVLSDAIEDYEREVERRFPATPAG